MHPWLEYFNPKTLHCWYKSPWSRIDYRQNKKQVGSKFYTHKMGFLIYWQKGSISKINGSTFLFLKKEILPELYHTQLLPAHIDSIIFNLFTKSSIFKIENSVEINIEIQHKRERQRAWFTLCGRLFKKDKQIVLLFPRVKTIKAKRVKSKQTDLACLLSKGCSKI